MYGFIKCPIPNKEYTSKHTQRIEGFKEGVGKWVSEIYVEEIEYFCRFSNGKTHILKAQYTEFRHDVKNHDDKTVIDWHWLDYPPYGNDVNLETFFWTKAI